MTRKLFRPFSMAVLSALLFAGVMASPAQAQEYKETYNAGIEAAKAKDYNKAYASFTEAARLAKAADDNDIAQRATKVAAQLDYNIGRNLVAQEKFEDGLKRFEQGIKLNPQYAKNYLGKALALKKLNRGEDAVKAYVQLIAVGKESNDSGIVRDGEEGLREYFVFLASSALGRRDEPTRSDAQEALEHLEALQEYVEADADTYFYMAAAHNALGNYSQAVQLSDQALELHRGSRTDAAKIHFVRGEALMYDGNVEEAKASFRNATFGSYKSLAEHYLETL